MQYICKFWIGTFNERFLSKSNGDYNIQTLYILLTCIYLQFEGSDNQTRHFCLFKSCPPVLSIIHFENSNSVQRKIYHYIFFDLVFLFSLFFSLPFILSLLNFHSFSPYEAFNSLLSSLLLPL